MQYSPMQKIPGKSQGKHVHAQMLRVGTGRGDTGMASVTRRVEPKPARDGRLPYGAVSRSASD